MIRARYVTSEDAACAVCGMMAQKGSERCSIKPTEISETYITSLKACYKSGIEDLENSEEQSMCWWFLPYQTCTKRCEPFMGSFCNLMFTSDLTSSASFYPSTSTD